MYPTSWPAALASRAPAASASLHCALKYPTNNNMILKVTGRTRGAFATVIVDPANSRAYKIFKNNQHPDYRGGDSFDNMRNRLVFNSEVEAYETIAANPFPVQHTPEFYGIQVVEKVLDSDDNDISGGYLLDCCYCMGLCVGNEAKPWQLLHSYIEEFATQMSQRGINYLIDSSVFNPDSAENFMFIDFAMHDAAGQYDFQQELNQ
jgi:hypothetical protein